MQYMRFIVRFALNLKYTFSINIKGNFLIAGLFEYDFFNW